MHSKEDGLNLPEVYYGQDIEKVNVDLSNPENWRKAQPMGFTAIPEIQNPDWRRNDFLNTEDKFILNSYDGGGYVDLFEEYEQQPAEVRAIYDKYQDKIIDGDFDYIDSAEFLKEMQSVGYTFDYGLDNEPYGLRPKGVKLNQLRGYEEFENGGQVKTINDKLVYRGDDNRLTTIGTIRNVKGEKRVYKSPFAKVFIKENTDELVENWAKENGYKVWKEDFGSSYEGGGSTKPNPTQKIKHKDLMNRTDYTAYVKINDYPYTATVRSLNSFKNHLNRKDEKFTPNVFGEITYISDNASDEWVYELNKLIDNKKKEMENKMENGGQLDSVSDMLPHSEPMGVIQPMNIMETVQPMYAGGGEVDTRLTIEEVQRIANETANTLGSDFNVTKGSVDIGTFDLDYKGEEYDGGTYLIMTNGNVVNIALPEKPVYYNYKTKEKIQISKYAGGGKILTASASRDIVNTINANSKDSQKDFDKIENYSLSEFKDFLQRMGYDLSSSNDSFIYAIQEDIRFEAIYSNKTPFEKKTIDQEGREFKHSIGLYKGGGGLENKRGYSKMDSFINEDGKEIALYWHSAYDHDEMVISKNGDIWKRYLLPEDESKAKYFFNQMKNRSEHKKSEEKRKEMLKSIFNALEEQIKYQDKTPAISIEESIMLRDIMRNRYGFEGGGQLKPIPEGNKGLPKLPEEVRNRMGYMENGGGVGEQKQMSRTILNDTVHKLIKKNGTDFSKYSQFELSTLDSYVSQRDISDEMAQTIWGLAIQNGFNGYMSKVLVVNSGTGKILNYVGKDFSKVDAVNPSKDENTIATLLNNIEVIDVHSDSLRLLSHYDLGIIINKNNADLSNLKMVCSKLKSNNMLIFVAPTSILYGDNAVKTYINEKFDLIKSFCDESSNSCISVLKKL